MEKGGDTNFIFEYEEDKIRIPKRPCNVLYFIDTDEIST